MVVTEILFLNSKPFSVLFDFDATHFFISTQTILKLNIEGNKEEIDYRISSPNGHVTECLILYKNVPIVIEGRAFSKDLIQFNLSEFNVIIRMN